MDAYWTVVRTSTYRFSHDPSPRSRWNGLFSPELVGQSPEKRNRPQHSAGGSRRGSRTGLHTNGYSLARRIFFERMKLKPDNFVRELNNTIGDELLKVHRSYGPLLLKLLRKFNPPAPGARPAVKGLAHITGGGFMDNIPRVLPKRCDVLVRKGSWEMPPIFEMIRARGGMEEAELYQVFNMGIGMTVIVAADRAEAALRFIRAQKQKAWPIGEVVSGRGIVKMI